MKALALGMALAIMAVGAVGIVLPSALVWVARQSGTSGAFYVIAIVRVAFGLILVSVAPVSRVPKTLRVLGYFLVIAGIATALAGLVAMDRARAIIEWWLQQGSGAVRLAGAAVLAIGSFIAYACAPARLR